MKQTAANFIGVKVEKTHEDTIGSFYLDPMHRPTQNAREFGKITHLPVVVSDDWNLNDDFMKVGDKVYFHFDAINDRNAIKIEEDGETIYIISLYDVFATVRDGKLRIRSGKAICKPYYDSGDSAVEVKEVDVDGKNVMAEVSRSSGLIIKTDIKPHDRIAYVYKIGNNLKHQEDLGLKEGDLVYREEFTNLEYTVEGEKVFILDQELILGKYE